MFRWELLSIKRLTLHPRLVFSEGDKSRHINYDPRVCLADRTALYRCPNILQSRCYWGNINHIPRGKNNMNIFPRSLKCRRYFVIVMRFFKYNNHFFNLHLSKRIGFCISGSCLWLTPSCMKTFPWCIKIYWWCLKNEHDYTTTLLLLTVWLMV